MERMPRAGWQKFLKSVNSAWAALMTPVLILGGIYSGLLTPTESAAVAGIWAVVIGFFVYRELTLKGLWNSLKATAATTSMIFAIIATASFLSVAFTYTRFPHKLIDAVIGIGATPFLFLLACGIVVLILGTFIEVVPIMYLTLPIFAPIATALDIDLLHLMIVFTGFVGMGLLTPPVCVGAYTAAAVAEEPAQNVIRAIFPFFFLVGIVYGLILIFLPGLATWLPGLL